MPRILAACYPTLLLPTPVDQHQPHSAHYRPHLHPIAGHRTLDAACKRPDCASQQSTAPGSKYRYNSPPPSPSWLFNFDLSGFCGKRFFRNVMFGRHRLRAICAPVMRCIGFVAGHFDWNCTGVVARRHVKRATEKTCWWGGCCVVSTCWVLWKYLAQGGVQRLSGG